MKKYIILDLDWTLIHSENNIRITIENYFKKNYPDYIDELKYNLNFNKISNLKDLIDIVLKDNESKKNIISDIYKELDKQKNKTIFIEWAIEKVIELWNNYKLFLSTWSSTIFAKDILEKWNISQYFELIQWSEEIPKSEKHLEIFKDLSGDLGFYNKAISIWDSDMDEYFAKLKGIKFINVWKDNKTIKNINIKTL